jgi:hypothetical protein
MGEMMSKTFAAINGYRDVQRMLYLGETKLAMGRIQKVSLLNAHTNEGEQVFFLEVKSISLNGLEFSYVVLDQQMAKNMMESLT